ncbi:MAG: VOC family protein [Clostridia bacterium]|nr:VOC family protein [Clostridia bacterium]NLS84450.1 VOC family protein [Oscillospiraceae bacterium]
MSREEIEKLNFSIEHFGVNCESEKEACEMAALFAALFGLQQGRSNDGAVFTQDKIEWMKQSGRGKHGHIGIATDDLPAARKLIESEGYAFDESSIKLRPDKSIWVIYFKYEFAGFAVHLAQR